MEEANVLDGNHRLVGERCDQIDLLVSEGLDFGPPDHDYSNEGTLLEWGPPRLSGNLPGSGLRSLSIGIQDQLRRPGI